MENTEYVPYGPEWAKEINKLPKKAIIEMMSRLGTERDKLRDIRADLLAVMTEISEGYGRYNEVPLIHASNTIEDMKELAINALLKHK